LIKGFFVKRKNRFTCIVKLKDRLEEAYLPNPGRLEEILIPNNILYLVPSSKKLPYMIIGGKVGDELVSLDSRLPNKIVYRELLSKRMNIFGSYERILKEFKVNKSKFDFLLLNGKKKLLEVKSVTLVVNRVGLFPDAPTERGRRHLLDMVKLLDEGYECNLLFVIQRSDVDFFKPNEERDKGFYDAFKRAYEKGVNIKAIKFKKIVNFRDIELDGLVEVIL